MNFPLAKRGLLALGVAGSLLAFTNQANASAFQLWEQNGSGVGMYHAGGAALAQDASTNFFNPAGLTNLKHQQFVLAGIGIYTDFKFDGTVNGTSTNGPTQGGGPNYIPAFYYALPFKHMAFGFGVSVPFGLSTDWNNRATDIVATETSMKTINLNPNFAIDLGDHFTVAAGVDVQQMKATFNDLVHIADLNIRDQNEGSDWGRGWNAGVMVKFTPKTRLGLSYRSKIVHHMGGTSYLTNNGIGIGRSHISSSITLPATTMLSAFHKFNRWSIMGSAAYTQWDQFPTVLTIQSTSVPGGTTNASTPNHYRNTWNFAVGTQFQMTKKWRFEAGAGYDISPVRSAVYRNIRLPDNNRYALSFGIHYQPIKPLGVDVGWTHIFVKDARLDSYADIPTSPTGSTSVLTTGSVNGSADVVGLQLTYTLV